MPVVVSILITLLIAVLQRQSRVVAAVTATMPVNITLGLWIVYASSEGDQETLIRFSQGLVTGIIPTLFFLAAIYIATRAGLRLVPMLLVGYTVWALALAAVMAARRFLGI